MVTIAQAVSVYYDFSDNNENGAGCVWATADGQTCPQPASVDVNSCTCPSTSGCSAIDEGDLENVIAWLYDGQGQGVSSCIVLGEGL